MTDVLISAGELADLVEDRTLCHHRHAQSGCLCAGPSARRRECARHLHLPRDLDAGGHAASSKPKFADAFGAAGLSGKETAVIYEQSMNSGFGQSCRGYYLLTMLGYPKIKVLHGGFDAWAAAGPAGDQPTSPAPAKASFAIVPEAGEILIDAEGDAWRRSASPALPSSTCATSMSGSARARRPTARISARARAASPARCGSNGIA